MTEEQEIALQRIKDPAYIKCEGTKEEVALLQFLLEKVANLESGSKTLANLKRQEDLPEGHKVVIKIQESKLIGLPSANAVHRENGEIFLFTHGRNVTDEKILSRFVKSLAHELYHENQFQQGLTGPFSNFTPEQNFILDRLIELDALNNGRRGMDQQTKDGFEGVNGAAYYASVYNHQAFVGAVEGLYKGTKSDKSFEEIRNTLVKRLGGNIDPEYFSAQTLANSPAGQKYFVEGKLPIQSEIQEMENGQISVYKHPNWGEIKFYTPKEGRFSVEERQVKNGEHTYVTMRFVDQESSEVLLGIEKQDGKIREIQTKENPDGCQDIKDIQEVLAQMNLSEEVLNAFDFDPKKIESFISSPSKTDLRQVVASLSDKGHSNTHTSSAQMENLSSNLVNQSRQREI